MQLLYQTGLTSDDYLSRRAWQKASLSRCPNHPQGGCAFARHGTYRRKTPAGTRIAQGMDTLIDHALNGFSGNTGVMPKKGERVDLSDEEVIGAVEYMVGQVDQ